MSHRSAFSLRPVPRLLAQASLLGLSLAPLLAGAQEAPQVVTLPTVNVQGSVQTYGTSVTTTATKTDSLIRDIPQSITVITQQLVHDQSMQSIADVVRYIPGVGIANGEGNRDSPIFRGISSASGDMYIDGIRDDVEYYRDLYNISSVEALTGPNAMIFGRGGSGGVINRVSKPAVRAETREAQVTLGSWNNRRLTADVGTVVNDVAAVRLNALYQESDGFQTNFHQKREGVNPTVSLKLDGRTEVQLGYEYFKDQRVTDRGIPSYQGAPLNVDISTFFGDPDPASRPTYVTINAVSGLVTHEFANGVSLSNRTRYTDYDKFYQNYSAGALNAAGTTVPITAYNNHQWRKNTFNQTDVTGTIDAGGMQHKWLAGMELGQQNTDYLRMTGRFTTFGNGTTATIPVSTPAISMPVNYVLGASAADRNGRSEASIAGFYVQDQMELSQKFQVIAGVRFDKFDLKYHDNVSGANLSSSDNLVSPRIGVVYKPVEAVSIYGNYSLAYFPRGGDQLSSLSTANQNLSPEKFVNYEMGVKWDILPALSSRVAVYRLNRTNVAIADPANATSFLLVDGQRTTGVEVGLSGNITDAWSVMGGYAYQDSRLTATASATAQDGSTASQVPQNTFSLWNRYDFNATWGAGLGLSARSSMYTSTSNAVTLPGYARWDAALFYKLNKNVQMQANVENITDLRYYTSANSDNNITPGAPINVRVGLTATF